MNPQQTDISWTDSTLNDIHGCHPCASPGCKYCYAVDNVFRHACKKKFNADHRFDPLVAIDPVSGEKRFTGVVLFNPAALYPVINIRKPQKIFVNEFADLLFEDIPIELIAEHFKVFRAAGQHVFQVLTKRGSRLAEVDAAVKQALGSWPDNVCMGVSVCSAHKTELERINQLGATGAKVKWTSFEPWLSNMQTPLNRLVPNLRDLLRENNISWSVIGGESAPKDRARLMTLDDARYLINESLAAGAKTHFKQLGTALAINLGVYSTRGKGEHNRSGANPDRWPDGPFMRDWPDVVQSPVRIDYDFTPDPAFAKIMHYGHKH